MTPKEREVALEALDTFATLCREYWECRLDCPGETTAVAEEQEKEAICRALISKL